VNEKSFLFITLDSCRYDAFENADVPNMKKIGPLHKAEAPSYFTFSSHTAMFVGFTPGIAQVNKPYLNPKFGKILKMVNTDAKTSFLKQKTKKIRKMISGEIQPKGNEFITLSGENIIQGFNNLGYITIGTGSVNWFNPETDGAQPLIKDFRYYSFPGRYNFLEQQLEWVNAKIQEHSDKPLFIFINVGETHVPYYYNGANWDRENRCVAFGTNNDAEICRMRQTKCLEFIDEKIGRLLEKFADASVLICSDHGDCWGEDGLWEHGFHHEKVITVPLIIRLNSKPV